MRFNPLWLTSPIAQAVHGVEENMLESTYDQYLMLSAYDTHFSYAKTPHDKLDVVRSLFTDAGKGTHSQRSSSSSASENIVTFFPFFFIYSCDVVGQGPQDSARGRCRQAGQHYPVCPAASVLLPRCASIGLPLLHREEPDHHVHAVHRYHRGNGACTTCTARTARALVCVRG